MKNKESGRGKNPKPVDNPYVLRSRTPGGEPPCHEMARDEARHGKALKGLHDRYFAADIAKEKVVNAAEKAADKVGNAVNSVVEKIKNM